MIHRENMPPDSGDIQSVSTGTEKVIPTECTDLRTPEDEIAYVRKIIQKEVPQAVIQACGGMRDAMQIGLLALYQAKGRFHPGRGTRLETFAYKRVKGAVIDQGDRNGGPLSRQEMKLRDLIRKVRNKFATEDGNLSSTVVVASMLGVSPEIIMKNERAVNTRGGHYQSFAAIRP